MVTPQPPSPAPGSGLSDTVNENGQHGVQGGHPSRSGLVSTYTPVPRASSASKPVGLVPCEGDQDMEVHMRRDNVRGLSSVPENESVEEGASEGDGGAERAESLAWPWKEWEGEAEEGEGEGGAGRGGEGEGEAEVAALLVDSPEANMAVETKEQHPGFAPKPLLSGYEKASSLGRQSSQASSYSQIAVEHDEDLDALTEKGAQGGEGGDAAVLGGEELGGGLGTGVDGDQGEELGGGSGKGGDGDQGEELGGGLGEGVDGDQGEELGGGLGEGVDGDQGDELGGGLEEGVDGDQGEELGGGLGEGVDGDQGEELGGGLGEGVDGDQGEELGGGLGEGVDGDQGEELGGGLGEGVDGDQGEELGGGLGEGVDGDQGEELGGGSGEGVDGDEGDKTMDGQGEAVLDFSGADGRGPADLGDLADEGSPADSRIPQTLYGILLIQRLPTI
eukprot:gene12657-15889_t